MYFNILVSRVYYMINIFSFFSISILMPSPSGSVCRIAILFSATARNLFDHSLQSFLFPVKVTVWIDFSLIFSLSSQLLLNFLVEQAGLVISL